MHGHKLHDPKHPVLKQNGPKH